MANCFLSVLSSMIAKICFAKLRVSTMHGDMDDGVSLAIPFGKFIGVRSVFGVGVLGTLAPGQYQMIFNIVYSEGTILVVIPYWPLLFV